ncbi:unnamed protein product, partial [Ixodes hexagonus]
QVRVHQPSVYSLFQALIVVCNSTMVVAICTFLLRCLGTCGASSCQDVTINYRLLFRAYAASSCIVVGCVTACAIVVVTSDINIDEGVHNMASFVDNYRALLHEFLAENMIKAADKTLEELTVKLKSYQQAFGAALFLLHSGRLVTQAKRTEVRHLEAAHKYHSGLILFVENHIKKLSRVSGVLESAEHTILDGQFTPLKKTVAGTLDASTLFQRQGVLATVRNLLDTIKGQVYYFKYELENVQQGVATMTSILLNNEAGNSLFIPVLQGAVSMSIKVFVVFAVISMGGMMGGFVLGFMNYKETHSPLDRSVLSNLAGYILVLTSYIMAIGATVMLALSAMFMLLGCIGDIYLCDVERQHDPSTESDSLKDLTISLMMNATTKRYHVEKLLKYSQIERHCKEHLGIAGLAGIHSRELEGAIQKLIGLQYDLDRHYTMDMDDLIRRINLRGQNIILFKTSFEAMDLLMGDNQRFIEALKTLISDDLKLSNFTENEPVEFKAIVEHAFLDDILEKCNHLKESILYSLDSFDSIGNCSRIEGVFNTCFRLLCDGVLDFVNSYWLAIMAVVPVYYYAIYISMSGSKYLYTMKSYTYEGEPVKPEYVFVSALEK